MSFILHRPLVIFDIESTGPDVLRDRVIELALVKLIPDETQHCLEWRINPEMPIPKSSTEIHHITDADVADKPTFASLAPTIAQHFRDVDVGGFNARRFDLPMLECEFARAGIEPAPFADAAIIDAQEIFHSREARTLVAAAKFYCNENHADAHSAKHDALVTLKVLQAQLQRYADLPHEIAALANLFQPKTRYWDPTRKLILDNQGNLSINFGTHRGMSLNELAKEHRSYLEWILQGEWHPKVIKAVRDALFSSEVKSEPQPAFRDAEQVQMPFVVASELERVDKKNSLE